MPTCKGKPDDANLAGAQTLIWREGDEVCIRIAKRKNRPKGSGILRRRCCCEGSVDMCPVHTLWDRFFARLPEGSEPWKDISPGAARGKLRALLHRLGIVDADLYGTHDFRRGHAEVAPCAACAVLVCMSISFCAGHAEVWPPTGEDPGGRPVAQRSLFDLLRSNRIR